MQIEATITAAGETDGGAGFYISCGRWSEKPKDPTAAVVFSRPDATIYFKNDDPSLCKALHVGRKILITVEPQ